MDPKANLREQREIARRLQAALDAEDVIGEIHNLAEDAGRLAELVLALDDWRKRGGFDPYQ
jgi:hypothetical protein